MPAPASIAHTHVHSMRLAGGEEALVARARTAEGVLGFGFTLNFEAVVAREMAAWDAAARMRAMPLHALFGKKSRERVELVVAHAGAIDPFAGATLEEIRGRAQESKSAAFLAPHAHPWEIQYCAALAASVSGDARIAVPRESPVIVVAVSDEIGIGIDWLAEPAFSALRWIAP
jgi:L-alanine-DL-glutamate epimerase-like enolase superfamily enzyme